MLYITIIILILLAFQGYKREKSIINIQTLFCLLWCIVCYMASLRLYDMIYFSDEIYVIFLVGCLGFSIGCNLYKPIYRHFAYNTSYSINQRYFNLTYYVVTVFMVYFTIKTIFLLKSGVAYSDIRNMWGVIDYEGAMITSKFEIFIRNFILMPVIPVFNCLLLLHILRVINIEKKGVIQILILCVLYIFVSGSRIVITNLLFQGFLFIFLFKIKLQKRLLKKIIVGIVLLGIAISAISEYREREHALVDWDTTKTYYAYCALPVPMCSYHKERADQMNFRSYGLSFFKGPISLILYPASILGIPRPTAFMETEDFYSGVNEYVSIFYGLNHNAYVSLFFYFYVDFGLIGVFLGSLIYGAFLYWLYRKTTAHCNLRNILLLLIAFISLSKCFAKWEFQSTEYILSFVYVYLLTRKNIGITKISKI